MIIIIYIMYSTRISSLKIRFIVCSLNLKRATSSPEANSVLTRDTFPRQSYTRLFVFLFFVLFQL